MPADTPHVSPAPLIELDRARVIRDQVPVLHDVSLRLDLGRHAAILGPNGCGKSSFVKLIHRELYPIARAESPPARVFGQARWSVAALRQRLGIVSADLHADLAQLRGLDVEDTVLSGARGTFGLVDGDDVTAAWRAQAHAALSAMGALPLLHRRLQTLSAGEARRVLIARALVNRPQALLLDEPSTGLDLVARQHLIATMRTLAAQGITLVLVTHHIEEVIPEIERVVLLRGGRIAADGTRAELLRDGPLSEVFGGPIQVVEHEGRLTAFAG